MSTNRTLIESALLDLKTKMAEMAKKEEELKKQLKESSEMEPDQILIGRKLFVRNEEGIYFNADMSLKAKKEKIQEVLEDIEDPKTTETMYFIWPEEG